jgi:preprotein translocase subunit YajC
VDELAAGSRVITGGGKTGTVLDVTLDAGEHVAWIALDERSIASGEATRAPNASSLNRWPFSVGDLTVIDA